MLEKTTVEVSLAQTINQKSDDKAKPATEVIEAVNRRFNKLGRTDKRPGHAAETVTINAPNVTEQAFGSSNTCSTLASWNDHLVAINRNEAKALIPNMAGTGDGWRWLGYAAEAKIDRFSSDMGRGTQGNPVTDRVTVLSSQVAVVGDLVVTFSQTSAGWFYSVKNEATGQATVPVTPLAAPYGINELNVRLVGASARAFLVGTNAFRELDLSGAAASGWAASAVTLPSGTFTTTSAVDAVLASDGTSLVIVIARWSRASGLIYLDAVSATGAILPLSVTLARTSLSDSYLCLAADNEYAPGVFYMFTVDNSSAVAVPATPTVTGWRFTISPTAYALASGPVAVPIYDAVIGTGAQRLRRANAITAHIIPGGTARVFVSDSELNNSEFGMPLVPRPGASQIFGATVNTDIAVTDRFNGPGILGARSFYDPGSAQSIVVSQMPDPLNSAYYLLSARPREMPSTFYRRMPVIAKMLTDRAAVLPSALLPTVAVLNGDAVPVSNRNTHLIATIESLDLAATSVEQVLGVRTYRFASMATLMRFTLQTTQPLQSVQVQNQTLIAGSVLQRYDGQSFSEATPLQAPARVWVQSKRRALEHTFTNGTGSVGARIDLPTVPAALLYNTSKSTATEYLVFWDATDDWCLYFKIDGVAVSNPVAGANPIEVSVDSDMSPVEVAQRINAAMIASGASGSFNTSYNPVGARPGVRIECVFTGSVTTPTVFGMQTTVPGRTAGSVIQYTAVVTRRDSSGLLSQSAPTQPVGVTSLSNDSGGWLMAECPDYRLSDENSQVDFYRTLPGGSIFYYCGTAGQPFGFKQTGFSDANRSVAFFVDQTTDADVQTSRTLYTTGGVLPNAGIGQARSVIQHKQRVLIATEDEGQVLVSKALLPGEPIEFAAENEVRVYGEGGEITALASLDEKLIIFKRDKIFVSVGEFGNDLGQGSTLTQPSIVSSDAGCISAKSIITIPDGLLFKSAKGIKMLTRGLQVVDIGVNVENFDALTTTSTVIDAKAMEARFFNRDQSECLVFNYFENKWTVWTNHRADDAERVGDTFYHIDQNGVVRRTTEGYFADVATYGGAPTYYASRIKMSWLRVRGPQDIQRIYRAMLLGEYKTPHNLTATFKYDFDESAGNAKSYTVTAATVVGAPTSVLGYGVYQVQFRPEIQKCQAVQVQFEETPTGTSSGESATWNGVNFEVGVKKGMGKVDVGRKRS